MPTRKYGYDDAEIYRPGEQTPAERRQNPVGHLAEEAAFQGLSVNPLVHLADSLRGIHLKGRIGGLQLAKQAYDVRAKAIRSMNDVALAREEGALVPLKIEHEKQLIEHERVRANVAMNVFLHGQERQVQIADREHKMG